MTYFRNHRRGLEKDRRCPALRPPELGENRRGAVRGASPFSAAYPLRGGYFPGGHGLDSPELVSAVLEELDVGSLGFLENSNSVLTQLQEALKAAGFGFDEFRKAQALYWLALSPFSEEPNFIEKLVGCFAQTRPMKNWLPMSTPPLARTLTRRNSRRSWPPLPATWWPSPNPRSGRPAASPIGLGTASAPGWNGAPFLYLGAPTSAATLTRGSSPSSPAAA